ncbi:MAG: (d)CMP kinase [Phycisphaerales bacterium]|nr:MAG: (d)CMP kinase [Phycisphaerales bacterium]
MIVTIDGPAGSGKSTAARKLAARLEVAYLDTGAMYRAIALACLRRGVDLNDPRAVEALAMGLDLDLDCGPTHTRVRVDGHDVSEAIREMSVSEATPSVAGLPAVREYLVKRQRQIAAGLGSLVTEGRDQGSVVFPHAQVRIVLEASLEKRAERRYQELAADGQDVTLAQVRDNLRRRDRDDARHWTPLVESGAATVVDTTEMTLAQVIDDLERLVRARRQER